MNILCADTCSIPKSDIVFQSDCTILHSWKEWINFPIAPHPNSLYCFKNLSHSYKFIVVLNCSFKLDLHKS